jgi:glycosidase
MFFFLSAQLARAEDFNNLRIYQVMVSSFQNGDSSIGYGSGYGPSHHAGDLRGIINSLDYIKNLGFNALWMTPIFDSTNGQGGTLLQSTGYFATNYFKVDPKFGSETVLKELISKAHSKGLYVILDGVFGHHGGVSTASPNGKYPQGGSNPVSYPGSLDYYKEVAKYWIKNYGIDGWRLDQCYQMYQNGHNYLKEIRVAIEEACAERKAAGEKWGTLGYIVGEHWSGVGEINTQTYGGNGLKSAFDFPSRYHLVQAIAMEESGAGGYGAGTLANVFRTPSQKGYISGVYPNMFISNHDVWRFGNLVRGKYGEDVNSENYYKRHKIALATLAAYTGPITVYYGDETGQITDCWRSSSSQSCGSNTASDNCARTNGVISGFTTKQQDLHDFTAKVMKLRAANPAMWRGTNSNTVTGNVLFNCKWDESSKNKVVFACNLGTSSTTASYTVGGTKLTDLITGKTFTSSNGTYKVEFSGLGVYLFKVE